MIKIPYPIFLKIDQPFWIRNDYSDTNKLTGTVYTDKEHTTPFDLTGYTIKIRMFKRWESVDFFNKTGAIVIAASGTWSYAVNLGEMATAGIFMLKLELSKTGEQISTDPVEFKVLEAPAA